MKPCHALFLALLLFATACKKDNELKKTDVVYDNGPTDNLKINQIQIIASHNSYHLKPDSLVYRFLERLDSLGSLPRNFLLSLGLKF